MFLESEIMGLIFRIIRMLFPLILAFVVFRILRSLLASFAYRGYSRQHSGGSQSSNSGPFQGSGNSSSFRDPYAVLGCSSRDSDEEIRKCYRKMVAKYHPDKFIGQDLDQEFVELATRRFREIQSAYEQIRKMRGMK